MFFRKKPHPKLKVSVIVPVKDEEENILPCLQALRSQLGLQGRPLQRQIYEVLVLANNCRDNTYALVKEYQRQYPSFALRVEEIRFAKARANIGTARRFLMDIAQNRFDYLDRPEGIIASTDGDSRVDAHWVSEILQEMERGSEVVGGQIITEVPEPSLKAYHKKDIRYHNLQAELLALTDPLSYNPMPTHFQCFGASLAVRSDVYQQAAGLPQLPYLEDVAFVKVLERRDVRIRNSQRVKVYTSGRICGRVERGLSQQLAWFWDLSRQHQTLRVEAAEALLSRYMLKKSLRDCWESKKVDWDIAPFSKEDLQEWAQLPYFGEAWESAEQQLERIGWFAQWPLQEIDSVIADLQRMRDRLSKQSAASRETPKPQQARQAGSRRIVEF